MTYTKYFFENDTKARKSYSFNTGTVTVLRVCTAICCPFWNYRQPQLMSSVSNAAFLQGAQLCSLSQARRAEPRAGLRGQQALLRSALGAWSQLDLDSKFSPLCPGTSVYDPQFPHLEVGWIIQCFVGRMKRVSLELGIGQVPCTCSLPPSLYPRKPRQRNTESVWRDLWRHVLEQLTWSQQFPDAHSAL